MYRECMVCELEVCMDPYLARQMRNGSFNVPSWQMRGDFSNGPGQVGKREIIVLTARPDGKKIKFSNGRKKNRKKKKKTFVM